MLCSETQASTIPDEITILTDVEIPVAFAVTDSVQPIQAGTKVSVKSVHGKQVRITHGAGDGLVDVANTDFAERSIIAAKQAAAQAAALAEKKETQAKAEAEQRKATREAARQAPAGRIRFTDGEMKDAYYSARKAVEGILSAPTTAKFSNPHTDSNTGWESDGEGRIICYGHVDSQNSLGAMIRTPWRVWVQPEGEQWRLVRAMLDGEVLIDERSTYKTGALKSAEAFLGMTPEVMLAEFGQPLEVSEGSNIDDGPFKIYSFDKTKGRETFFTIWEREGVVNGGMFKGVPFSYE